jgi:hypothetical protein
MDQDEPPVSGDATAATAADVAVPIASPCPNCGQAQPQQASEITAQHRFCAACGQPMRPHAPTFWEFVHEFVGHYISLEGHLWPTLRDLFLRPGALTMAYLRGQRTRYVLPLRLFLSASFAFFLLTNVLGDADPAITITPTQKSTQGATQGAEASSGPSAEKAKKPNQIRVFVSYDPEEAERLRDEVQKCRTTPSECSAFRLKLLENAERLTRKTGLARYVSERFMAAAPYMVFALVPLSAALIQWAYWRRRRNYGEHFVFVLHLHAMGFLLMLVGHAMPAVGMPLAMLLMLGYSVLAMHRVYQGRWFATALRAGVIGLSYLTALGLAIACVLAVVVWKANE